MNSGKTFRILSIDGGGILGLHSSEMLRLIQKEILATTKLHDHFDLICGTSTGGIIALALASGKPIEEIVGFYREHGNSIFPYKSRASLALGSLKIVFGTKYKNSQLKRVLRLFFGTLKVRDLVSRVCIPAIDVENCQPIVFKTSHGPGLSRDDDVELVDIALATSAAPTYFPLHKFGAYKGLADGGLWQNNPSLVGVMEANRFFVGPGREFDSISVLSIGNPLSDIKRSISTSNRHSSLMKWNVGLVELPMKVSSFATHQILRFLNESNSLHLANYCRLTSKDLTREQMKLSLDWASPKALASLVSLANHDYYRVKSDLIRFFGG